MKEIDNGKVEFTEDEIGGAKVTIIDILGNKHIFDKNDGVYIKTILISEDLFVIEYTKNLSTSLDTKIYDSVATFNRDKTIDIVIQKEREK